MFAAEVCGNQLSIWATEIIDAIGQVHTYVNLPVWVCNLVYDFPGDAGKQCATAHCDSLSHLPQQLHRGKRMPHVW